MSITAVPESATPRIRLTDDPAEDIRRWVREHFADVELTSSTSIVDLFWRATTEIELALRKPLSMHETDLVMRAVEQFWYNRPAPTTPAAPALAWDEAFREIM